MGNSDQNDEKVIDLGDMFAETLRHWKSILLVGLVIALISGLVSYGKSSKEVKMADTDRGAAADTAKSGLTDTEIKNVERLYYQYISLQYDLKEEEDYYKNSILYHIDSKDLKQYQIEYVYTSNNPDIVQSFATQTLDDEEKKTIASIMGEPDQYQFADELVNIKDASSSSQTNSNLIVNSVENSNDEIYRGVFFVNISAESSDELSQIADVARKAISDHAAKMQTTGIKLDLAEVNAQNVSPDGVQQYKYQDTNDDRFSKLSTSVGGLTENEKTYYNYLINHGIASAEDTANAKGSSTKAESTVDQTPSVNKKYVLAGLLGGWIAMILLYMIIYAAGSSVKTVDDLESLAGGSVLGVLYKKPAGKGLNATINRGLDKIVYHGTPFSLETQLPLTASRIQRFAESKGVSHIYIALDASSDNGRPILEQLTEQPEVKNLNICIGDPTVDSDLFNQMDENSICVLVGTLKRTKADRIRQLRKICEEAGSQIAGAVVIDC